MCRHDITNVQQFQKKYQTMKDLPNKKQQIAAVIEYCTPVIFMLKSLP